MSDYSKRLVTGEAYVAFGRKMKEYTDEKFSDVERKIDQYEIIEEPDINMIMSDIDNE